MQCVDGFVFNRYEMQCDPMGVVEASEVVCPETGNERFPHERYCSQYYHCVDGVRYGAECREDQSFDAVTKRCVDRWFAQCDILPPTPPTFPPIITAETPEQPEVTEPTVSLESVEN